LGEPIGVDAGGIEVPDLDQCRARSPIRAIRLPAAAGI
jgi:hypothetical protein